MAYCNKPIIATFFVLLVWVTDDVNQSQKGIACEELLLFNHTLYEESVKQIEIRPIA